MNDLKTRILGLVKDELVEIEAELVHHLNPHLDLVREVAGHILFSGGKRLRPLLLVLAARMCDYRGDYDKTFSRNDSLPFILLSIGIFAGYGWAQPLHSWR